jgi:hypothetical protein
MWTLVPLLEHGLKIVYDNKSLKNMYKIWLDTIFFAELKKHHR